VREPRWIGRLVVEAVHLDLVREHGGIPGLRDEHALESALARPRQLHHYAEKVDLAALAASYAFGFARNHPFQDGNKRVAFVTAATFLMLNGWRVDAPEAEVVINMIGLASGEVSEDELAEWIRSYLVPNER
jgi:death-on-curing protein